MADAAFAQFLESGRTLLKDTKMPRRAAPAAKKVEKGAAKPLAAPASDDPHRVFVRKCVGEKPKKSEVVEMMQRFIDQAEEDL